MNFLAHIYLSGDNPQVQLGNFIGDWVKGKQFEQYPVEVAKGILLHRKIDSFTDQHPLVKESIQYFKPIYKRYSGIVTDVVFDHFLASAWSTYHHVNLHRFAAEFYDTLLSNSDILPKAVKGFLPYLISSNRLFIYQYEWGIQNALEIMSRHSSLPSESDKAIGILQINKTQLSENFKSFFEELKKEVEVGA